MSRDSDTKARNRRSVRSFCRDVAAYLGTPSAAADIERRVRNTAKRSLKSHKSEAAAMIARRGSAKKVLEAIA